MPAPFKQLTLVVLNLALLVLAALSGKAQAAPLQQAIVPPPTSQRVNLLGQTGGLISDFVIRDYEDQAGQGSLIYVPEGNALTILRLDSDQNSATVISRVSPQQGPIQGLAVSQDTAFLITPIGLAALDVHDPYNPQLLSFLPGGGEAVQVAGDFAYVAARAAGLRIINVAKPGRPVLVSILPLPGKALALALDMETSLAYIGADEGGLRIIDISAPDLPREVASMEFPQGVQQLELEGKKLAVSSGERIMIVDVSRPDNPVLLGSYVSMQNGRRIKTDENYAYVADLDSGLKIFDISGDQPLLLYEESAGSLYDVLVQGSLVYTADGANGIRILNITSPASPQQISHIPLDGITQGLEIYDDTLYAACGQAGLYIIRISNPWKPEVIGHLDTDGDARDVKANENLAFVADGPSGVLVVSLVDKRAPELRGAIYTPGEAQAIGIDNNYVYVAADDGGLQIIETIRPAAPVLVGALALPEGQRSVDITLVNKRAYLAIQGQDPDDGGSGLAIADVSFKDQPTILSRVPGPGMGVTVQGVTVMTVAGNRIMTIDARASSGPVKVNEYYSSSGAGGMDWQGSSLFMTSGGEGPELTILDVSHPAQPFEVFRLGFGAKGGQVTAIDNRLFLAAGRLGLDLVDLSRPDIHKGSIYDPIDTLTRLEITDQEAGIIYGAGESGWSATNVQNPRLPQPVSGVQTNAPVSGLAKAGDQLYATSTTRGLLTFEVSDLAQPQLLGNWSLGTHLQDVLIRGGYLYLVDKQAGLRIIDPHPFEKQALLQTIPISGTPEKFIQLDQDLAYISTDNKSKGLHLFNLGHPAHGVEPEGKFPADINAIQVKWPIAYTLDGNILAVWDLEEEGITEPATTLRINGNQLLISGNRAFVGSDAGHVSVIDLSNPLAPHVRGMMGNTAAVRGFWLPESGTHLIVGLDATVKENPNSEAKHVGQLRIWNIGNPIAPEHVNTIEPLATFTTISPVAGRPRLVTVGDSLQIYDISSQETITHVTGITLPVTASCLFLADDFAYVGGENGLVVIQGIQSDSPMIVGKFSLDSAVSSITVYGNRGYLSLGLNGGLIVDLADPRAIKSIARLPSPTGGTLHSLTLENNRLWAAWDGWVNWLDISQPQAGPSEIAAVFPDDLFVQDLAVDGSTAYMVNPDAGLVTLDISDPSNPAVLGRMDTPGQAYAVAVGKNGIGYVADGECGLRVISLQDPANPQEIGFWHTGYAVDVQVLDDIVYLADIGELLALEYDPSGTTEAPPIPQSPQPADDTLYYPLIQALNDQLEITLNWGPKATHCDPLTYDIFFGTENPPPLVASGLVTTSYTAANLDRLQTYYWQVKAYDRQGDQTTGPVWKFHTSTQAHPPAAPTIAPKPILGHSQQDIILPLVGGLLAMSFLFMAFWLIRKDK